MPLCRETLDQVQMKFLNLIKIAYFTAITVKRKLMKGDVPGIRHLSTIYFPYSLR